MLETLNFHLIDSIGTIVILYLLVVVATIIVWIGTLSHQARRKRWVWFILTLISVPLTLIIYWIVQLFKGKKSSKKKRK